jgi:5-methyltetrahydrofolate--homocysteine methyltransferase
MSMGSIDVAVIGELINYGIPRVRPAFDARDMEAVKALARTQAGQGAEALDVNVGPLGAEAMARTIEAIQDAVRLPLCIDGDAPEILRAGVAAYDPARSAGLPILNSATEGRAEAVLAIRAFRPCRVILLVSERREGDRSLPNETPAQGLATARRLFSKAVEAGFAPSEIFIDPSTPAIAVDLAGLVNSALETILRVREERELSGVRIVAGLSNLTASLPPASRLPLQNAFLTLARRNGLDTIIGDPARDYRILPEGHPDLTLMQDILSRRGIERLAALTASELYRSAARRAAPRRAAGTEDRGGRA